MDPPWTPKCMPRAKSPSWAPTKTIEVGGKTATAINRQSPISALPGPGSNSTRWFQAAVEPRIRAQFHTWTSKRNENRRRRQSRLPTRHSRRPGSRRSRSTFSSSSCRSSSSCSSRCGNSFSSGSCTRAAAGGDGAAARPASHRAVSAAKGAALSPSLRRTLARHQCWRRCVTRTD
eukprot:1975879-Prymnesium_polylepis.1